MHYNLFNTKSCLRLPLLLFDELSSSRMGPLSHRILALSTEATAGEV